MDTYHFPAKAIATQPPQSVTDQLTWRFGETRKGVGNLFSLQNAAGTVSRRVADII
jgi:hypothetical protein